MAIQLSVRPFPVSGSKWNLYILVTCYLWSTPGIYIWGPLMFLLYVNYIPNVPFTKDSPLVMYADDLLLFKPISKRSFNFSMWCEPYFPVDFSNRSQRLLGYIFRTFSLHCSHGLHSAYIQDSFWIVQYGTLNTRRTNYFLRKSNSLLLDWQ